MSQAVKTIRDGANTEQQAALRKAELKSIEWKPLWEHDLDNGLRALRNGLETHLITLHAVLPLLVRRGRGLVVEVTDVPAHPYRLLMELLDSMKAGEVAVAGVEGAARAAIWGELLSTHTRAHGGRAGRAVAPEVAR